MKQCATRRSRASGFTLVEVLVTMVILSFLALAGTRAISNAVTARTALNERQAVLSNFTRAVILLRQDLEQVVDMAPSGSAGTPASSVRFDPQESILEVRIQGLAGDGATMTTVPGQVVWQENTPQNTVSRSLWSLDGAPISTEEFKQIQTISVDVFRTKEWIRIDAPQSVDLSAERGLRVRLVHASFGAFDVATVR